MIKVSEDEVTIVGIETDFIDLRGAPQKKITIKNCLLKPPLGTTIPAIRGPKVK